MINGIASMFEDKDLKVFSECVQQIGAAGTRTDVDLAVARANSVLEHIKDQGKRATAAQRLRMLADTAYLRLSH